MGDPEILHQIKLIATNVQLLEDLLYSHNHRHVYNGGDPLFGLDTSQIESGVFDLDRIPTSLKSKVLSEVFTAGADITVGQVVAITGDNEVSPADNTLRSQAIGVALNDAAVGEQVEVVIYGKTTVVADGVVSAGDPLAAAITAGRVVSLLSHSHTNPNTSSVDLAHTHGVGTLSIGAVGNHRHDCPRTRSAGGHSHSFTPSGSIGTTDINHRHSFTPAGSISTDSAGTPSGSIGTPSSTTLVAGSGHKHKIADIISSVAWSDPVARDDYSFYRSSGAHIIHCYMGSSAIGVIGDLYTLTPTVTTYVASSGHIHTFTGDALPNHSHSFSGSAGNTGYTNPSHSHGFTGSAGTTGSVGSHTHSVGYTTYAGGHSHSITGSTGSALGSHSHTQGDTGAVNNAQIVGKALTAAVGAGVEIDMLVCLAG